MLRAFLYFIYLVPLALLLWSARSALLVAAPFALTGAVAFWLWRVGARRKRVPRPPTPSGPAGITIRIIHER